MGLFRKARKAVAGALSLHPEPIGPFAEWIVQSLDAEPEDWTMHLNRLKHAGGASVYVHLDWTTKAELPGYGEIIAEAPVNKPGAAHEAVFAAAKKWQANNQAGAVVDYIARTAKSKAQRGRDDAERARRLAWQADGLSLQADDLRKQATALKATGEQQ